MIADNKKRIISKFEKQPESAIEVEDRTAEEPVQTDADSKEIDHTEMETGNTEEKIPANTEPLKTKSSSRPVTVKTTKTTKTAPKNFLSGIQPKIDNLKETMIKVCLSVGTLIAVFGICYGCFLIWQYSDAEKKDEPVLVTEAPHEEKIGGISISGPVYTRNENYEEWQDFMPAANGLPAQGFFKTGENSTFSIHNYQPAWKMRATGNSVLRIRKIEEQRRGLGHAIGINLEDGNFFFHTEESNVLFELEIDSYRLSGRRTSFSVHNHKGVLEIKNSRGALNLKIPSQPDVLLSAGKKIKIEHGRAGREQRFTPVSSVFSF
jgi:hypothetical protein